MSGRPRAGHGHDKRAVLGLVSLDQNSVQQLERPEESAQSDLDFHGVSEPYVVVRDGTAHEDVPEIDYSFWKRGDAFGLGDGGATVVGLQEVVG